MNLRLTPLRFIGTFFKKKNWMFSISHRYTDLRRSGFPAEAALCTAYTRLSSGYTDLFSRILFRHSGLSQRYVYLGLLECWIRPPYPTRKW